METGIKNADTDAAAAAAAAANAAPLHVPFTITAGAGGLVGTTTAAFADVLAAAAADRTVIADCNVNDSFVIYAPLSGGTPVENPTSFLFGAVAKVSAQEKPTMYQISFGSDGTVGVAADELT